MLLGVTHGFSTGARCADLMQIDTHIQYTCFLSPQALRQKHRSGTTEQVDRRSYPSSRNSRAVTASMLGWRLGCWVENCSLVIQFGFFTLGQTRSVCLRCCGCRALRLVEDTIAALSWWPRPARNKWNGRNICPSLLDSLSRRLFRCKGWVHCS